ncbi:MAG TPA: cupin domain-containing protein [Burkholderiales bacterium]|nr:cupin domain-containing protein [Burkholderiales bacterium]
MSAITPKVADHAKLPPLASRFVEVAGLPWEQTRFPGIETKTLLVDRESGVATLLMKMAPGAKLPDHEHVLIEQTYVLEGSLVCGEGECKAGEFVWRPAGSRHEAWGGPQGGVMLAMFQIANRFYEADGRETDVTGQDWDAAWGKALFREA